MYRLLSDVVVVAHVGFLLLLATGSVLAWRWPKMIWLHVPAVAWALWSVTIGVECPLTTWEKDLTRLAGERAYAGGFIDHYLEGALYPARLSGAIAILVAAVIAIGYARLVRGRVMLTGGTRRRARQSVEPHEAAA